MAIFDASNSRYPISMGVFGIWGASSFDTVDTVATMAYSSTFYRERLSNGYFAGFTGSNIQYDSVSDPGYHWPRSGSISKIELQNSSFNILYSLSGLSTSFEELLNLIESTQVVTWQTLLSSMMNGGDTVSGTSFADYLLGYGGNDVFIPHARNDNVDGGAGIDSVTYTSTRMNYTVTRSSGAVTVTDKSGSDGTDTLTNVERLKFGDGSAIALDIDGTAGQAYRLYQAAFDRKPDAAGLGTWIDYIEDGHTLKEVSGMFQRSDEFINRYGANVATNDFVTLLYQNVLHRAPDANGFATWTPLLDTNQWSRADVLIGFSESTENTLALIGVQQMGMEYIPAA